MERQQLLDHISDILSILAVKIHIENSNNQNSINIHAENLSIKLLNEVYNCDLSNANYIKIGNYPAIDLIDETSNIGFQVTSTPSHNKITTTLEKAVKYFEKSQIKKLRIFILSKKLDNNAYLKKSSKYNEIVGDKFDFNPEEDIIDGRSIYLELQKQNDLDKLVRIVEVLEKEFSRIPTISKQKYGIFIDFNFNDLELVLDYSKKLIQAGISVYTSCQKLQDKLQGTHYFGSITVANAFEIPSHIHYVSVFITSDYLRENKEKLNYLISSNKIVFPYIIDITVDAFEESLSFLTPLFFNKNKITNIASNTIKKLVSIEDGIAIQDDVLTVLKNFRPNDTFYKYGENKYDTNEIKTEGFDLYMQTTDDRRVFEYFAYIYAQGEKFNLNSVAQDLKNFLRDKKQPLTILVPKAKHLKNPEKRKSEIVKKFPDSTFHFIDDFAWIKCNSKATRDLFKENFLMIENFVIPYMQSIDVDGNPSGEIAQEDICNWLEQANEPTCVFLGSGGIGKTTVARKFSDFFLTRNNSVGVLFIEAENIISKLQQQSNNSDFTLFSFYYAHMTNMGLSDQCLSKEMFNLHFDNGKILIVIDGLDEVIARIPIFDIDDFIIKIHSSTQNNGFGKVLITCRNYFWLENRSTRANIFTIEILPFDEVKAKKFFEDKRYPNHNIVDKCLKISKKLSIHTNDKETFIPFILDVVSNLVENQINKALEPEDFEDFSSDVFKELKYLDENESNDYITSQLFEREILKSDQILTKFQFLFFMHLSVYHNGVIQKDELKNYFERLNISISQLQIKSFHAHPLITVNQSTFKLKYDFLNFYFQALFFSNYFNDTEEHNFDTQLIRNYENMTYNYGVTAELANRLKLKLNDNLSYIIFNEIRQISSQQMSSSRINKAISGLFALVLTLNHKSGSNTIISNTKILKDIFELKTGVIENLVITNLYNTNNVIIKFDFSDLNFKKASIENFEDFWGCLFNQNTLFEDSTFSNLTPRNNTLLSAKEDNFKDCIDIDNSLKKVFTSEFNNNLEIDTRVSEMLRTYLKITFYSGGNFKSRELDPFMKKHYSQLDYNPISFNKFLLILKNIIVETNNSGKHNKIYQIQTDLRNIVLKFILENNKRPIIKKIIKDIINEI